MKGRLAKKELQKLKILISLQAVWTAVLLGEVLLLRTGFLSDICLLGIIATFAAMIAGVFRSIKASELDAEERILQAQQFLTASYGNRNDGKTPVMTAGKVRIAPEERRNHPFYGEHNIDGKLEITGQIGKKNFRCRELYIYDITHRKGTQDETHNKKFFGTALQWTEKPMEGEYIICSETFFKQAVFHFERQGFEKMTVPWGKEILYVKGLADERDLRYLYEKFCYAGECFGSMNPVKPVQSGTRTESIRRRGELCLWYRGGKAEIYISQLLSVENDVRVLMKAIEGFLGYTK